VQVGIDIFVAWVDLPSELNSLLEQQSSPELTLTMVSNRGQLCYPDGADAPVLTDHYRCRFESLDGTTAVATESLIGLLSRLAAIGLPFVKTEGLFTFDGVPGFSLGQGQ
jgi:isocitrate dehydrogenase